MLRNQKRSQYLDNTGRAPNVYLETDGAYPMRGYGNAPGGYSKASAGASNAPGGYSRIHGGHSEGPATEQNGRSPERKASKLEMMRADYQKKIMKEKEEKMVHVYEENQKKAMERMQGKTSNGGISNGRDASGVGGGKSVREFFNERRRMEASGATVPAIDNHYRQAKGYSSPGGWSSRTGSGNSANKTSAGRDRANPLAPLAPIRRPMDTQEMTNNSNAALHGRSGIPQPQRQQVNGRAGQRHEGENVFNARPKLITRNKPLPPTNGYHQHDDNHPNDINGRAPMKSNIPKFTPQHRKPPQPPRQQMQPHESPSQGKHVLAESNGASLASQQKMTDFQKWQMDQDKTRENRLKKLNSQKKINYDVNYDEQENDEDEYTSAPSGRDTGRISHRSHQSKGPVSSRSKVDFSYEEEEEDGGEEDFIAQKERELMERIAKQQAELEQMRQDRHKEEVEETKEQERQRKREAAERARQKKIEEEQRKEEERRRKEEAEEEKQGRQRLEKQRKIDEKMKKEEEKQKKEDEKLQEKLEAKQKKEEEKRRKEEEKMQKEEEKRFARQQQTPSVSPRKGEGFDSSRDGRLFDEDSPLPTARRNIPVSNPKQAKKRVDEPVDLDERGLSDATYYLQQVKESSEAKGTPGPLSRCGNCGRSFAADRLEKHQKACVTVTKPRKTFDSSKKRVEGTELAKYSGKSKKEPPKKKSNWRQQHQQFCDTMRYNRKLKEAEKEGRDIRELGPPPVTSNPDLVPCPHCGRTFNESAAERHIPRCKDMKSKPKPMNLRKR